MKSVLGRSADPSKPDTVILGCIGKAYDDMLSAGRFYKIGEKAAGIESIHHIMEQHEYKFSPELICNVKKIFGADEQISSSPRTGRYVTTFGLAQKVVNMTFKYLFCFRDYTKLNIDFTVCDCPVDSIVLNQLKLGDRYVWSKLSQGDYADIQKAVDLASASLAAQDCSKRLLFDFEAW